MADLSHSEQHITRQHEHEKSMNSLDLKTAVISGTFEGLSKEDIDKFYYQNVIEATVKPKKGSFQIMSVTSASHVSDLKDDAGEDSQDDLDDTHTYTEDFSSLDCSKTTDAETERSPIMEQEDPSCFHQPEPPSQKPNLVATKERSSTDNQSRFRVVKIVTREPFRRGRWTCYDFLPDPHKPSTENPAMEFKEPKDHVVVTGSETSSASSSIHYVHGQDDPSKNPLTSTAQPITQTLTSPIYMDGESQQNQSTAVKPIHVSVPNGHENSHPEYTVDVPTKLNQSIAASQGGPSPDSFQAPSAVPSPGNIPGMNGQSVQHVPVTQSHMLSVTQTIPQSGHQPTLHQPSKGGGQQPPSVLANQTSSVAPQSLPPHSSAQQPPTLPGQSMMAGGKPLPAHGLPNTTDTHSIPASMGHTPTHPILPNPVNGPANPAQAAAYQTNLNSTVSTNPPVTQTGIAIGGAQQVVATKSSGNGHGYQQTSSSSSHNQSTANTSDFVTKPTNSGQPSLVPTVSNPPESVTLSSLSGKCDTRYTETKPIQVPQRTHRISTGGDDLSDDLQRAGATALLEQIAGIPGALGSPTKDNDGEDSGSSSVAIDNKIEQAMDLVKSHLMFAVREEVEVLREQIKELEEQKKQLEVENSILKSAASAETLAKLAQAQQQPPTSS